MTHSGSIEVNDLKVNAESHGWRFRPVCDDCHWGGIPEQYVEKAWDQYLVHAGITPVRRALEDYAR